MTAYDKKYIRGLFDDIQFQNELFDLYMKKDLTPEERDAIRKLHREQISTLRAKIHAFYKGSADPLRDSMLTGTRRTVRNGYEMESAYTEFWIDPDTGMTDDDISEILEDETVTFSSPYDCTGHLFTSRIYANRTPAGVVFINVLHHDY